MELVKDFRSTIDLYEKSDGDIVGLYRHLFSLFNDEELGRVLEWVESLYATDSKNWFYDFHKFLRQGDFYDHIHSYRLVNKQTEEDAKREAELIEIRMKDHDEFKLAFPDENMADYREWVKEPTRKANSDELRALTNLKRTQEPMSINGHLDMILWNTIHLDTKNILKSILMVTFDLKKD